MPVRLLVRPVVCVALVMLLSCCAGPGPGLTGNDTGGIIPWAPDNRELALDAAVEHCARWNKDAVATGVDARPGGYYSFSCKFDRRRL